MIDRRLAVAPMMDVTDRFYRYMARLLTRRTLLYTEMITTGAVLHGDRARLLAFDPAERPVALQLGGAEPAAMAESARIGADLGYDEININVGCPSDRVQSGRFGACLMAEPATVAACVAAMRRAVAVPVTVKSRIGIDDRDSYEHLRDFVRVVAEAGCEVFVVHARKAVLSGLSPKENREIPPLRHEFVHRLKADFPRLAFVINGGLRSLAEAGAHLRVLDGAMIGRAAMDTPAILAAADAEIYGDGTAALALDAAIDAYLAFAERERSRGVKLGHLIRPILNLFHGRPGGRLWRRHLSENAHKPGAGPELIRVALDRLPGRPAAAPAREAA